jgi:peptide/nickel transport system permease protein
MTPGVAHLNTADAVTGFEPPRMTHRQMFQRRFLQHRLAVVSGMVIVLFYVVALLADFLSTADPRQSNWARATAPPQKIVWTLDGRLDPHVTAQVRSRDPADLSVSYQSDPAVRVPVRMFVDGYEYRFLGLVPTNVHLFGAVGGADVALHPLGTDLLGRCLYSRLLHAMRTSLVIGLAAVAVSLALGVIMGLLSGFYGGTTDLLIQRLIEVLRAIPTIPLWMGLAAAIPAGWSVTAVYLAITLIIALIGWTELARELRGRVAVLRREDFVVAAELCGAGPGRIMRVHLLPSILSHIIAATTLAIPGMIASETALGFLGLGLRAPAISLGILLKDAQSLQNVDMFPWLLIPVIPTALIILAFNFLGDGLRDAADPYA